ncbi:MAG: hypothetical protein OXI90_01340 [Gammaproteobacteria bacterium]|nr:hypothetical protein [Gammaproteobacteria bacterium]
MNATVIDTLRFADSLKAAGFGVPQAEGLARALGAELAERMLTKGDLEDALRPINGKFDSIDARFESIDAKFKRIDARFEGIDARLDGIDARLDAMDTKFDAMDAKFDAMDAKFDAMDAKFDAMDAKFDAKIDSVHRELSGKFNTLVGVMALGFTLLIGLGGYNAVSPRLAETTRQAPESHQEATALPAAPQSRLLAQA